MVADLSVAQRFKRDSPWTSVCLLYYLPLPNIPRIPKTCPETGFHPFGMSSPFWLFGGMKHPLFASALAPAPLPPNNSSILLPFPPFRDELTPPCQVGAFLAPSRPAGS